LWLFVRKKRIRDQVLSFETWVLGVLSPWLRDLGTELGVLSLETWVLGVLSPETWVLGTVWTRIASLLSTSYKMGEIRGNM